MFTLKLLLFFVISCFLIVKAAAQAAQSIQQEALDLLRADLAVHLSSSPCTNATALWLDREVKLAHILTHSLPGETPYDPSWILDVPGVPLERRQLLARMGDAFLGAPPTTPDRTRQSYLLTLFPPTPSLMVEFGAGEQVLGLLSSCARTSILSTH